MVKMMVMVMLVMVGSPVGDSDFLQRNFQIIVLVGVSVTAIQWRVAVMVCGVAVAVRLWWWWWFAAGYGGEWC